MWVNESSDCVALETSHVPEGTVYQTKSHGTVGKGTDATLLILLLMDTARTRVLNL